MNEEFKENKTFFHTISSLTICSQPNVGGSMHFLLLRSLSKSYANKLYMGVFFLIEFL